MFQVHVPGRLLRRALAALAACVAVGGCIPQGTMLRAPDVAFEPTPMEVVSAMLRLADIKPYDTVFDLGCGDGRIVMAAARFHGARGVCVELDRHLVYEGRRTVHQTSIADRITFLNQDLFTTDIGDATVVMLYLSQEVNLRLRSKLQRELRPGARVISHAYDMGDWAPREIVRVTSGGQERSIYLWVIEGYADNVFAGIPAQ